MTNDDNLSSLLIFDIAGITEVANIPQSKSSSGWSNIKGSVP